MTTKNGKTAITLNQDCNHTTVIYRKVITRHALSVFNEDTGAIVQFANVRFANAVLLVKRVMRDNGLWAEWHTVCPITLVI